MSNVSVICSSEGCSKYNYSLSPYNSKVTIIYKAIIEVFLLYLHNYIIQVANYTSEIRRV